MANSYWRRRGPSNPMTERGRLSASVAPTLPVIAATLPTLPVSARQCCHCTSARCLCRGSHCQLTSPHCPLTAHHCHTAPSLPITAATVLPSLPPRSSPHRACAPSAPPATPLTASSLRGASAHRVETPSPLSAIPLLRSPTAPTFLPIGPPPL